MAFSKKALVNSLVTLSACVFFSSRPQHNNGKVKLQTAKLADRPVGRRTCCEHLYTMYKLQFTPFLCFSSPLQNSEREALQKTQAQSSPPNSHSARENKYYVSLPKTALVGLRCSPKVRRKNKRGILELPGTFNTRAALQKKQQCIDPRLPSTALALDLGYAKIFTRNATSTFSFNP